MRKTNSVHLVLFVLVSLLVGCGQDEIPPNQTPPNTASTNTPAVAKSIQFDGNHAFISYLIAQTNLGFRPVGSAADKATGDFIISQVAQPGLLTVTQEFQYRGLAVRNVIAKAAQGRGPIIIIGAHYDTRLRADQDKEHPEQPVLGANDGASGVAVLLELARTLDVSKLKNELWLAFLDAEDDGELSGCIVAAAPCDASPWPWSVGATYVADHLVTAPEYVVIVDMIGDKDQNIYYEQNSDKPLQEELWRIAANQGYAQQFIPEFKWSMDDDHTPFLQKGFRAVDIIDFDYPYWHTTQDTPDKCSPESLERVGRVLQTWLYDKQQ